MTSLFFDITLIVLILASSIVGFIRGFTREFFGALGWICATFVTLYGFHFVYPLTINYVTIKWLQYVVTCISLFLPSYIVFRFLSGILSKIIKDSFLSSLDRTLGFAWGAIRGIAIMCFLFLGSIALQPNVLEYFNESRALPLIRTTSLFLLNMLPKNFEKMDVTKYLAEPIQPSSADKTKLLSSMMPNVEMKNKPLQK